ncbi:MAG: ribbon-helix-helix protein, CopG family [Candidatus Kerfeldbacteria bacterium]|nr:ribbon-helix-helix protein, CopG family [Candidatus Kerfeldbacteria bacterium]
MRDVINISLPKALTKEVRKAVRGGRYASTSEFFRAVLRDWLEEKMYSSIQQSEQEIRVGKAKKLRSLRDLR